MARFPKAEAEIAALAQAMVSGLTDNAATYPAPPVLPGDCFPEYLLALKI